MRGTRSRLGDRAAEPERSSVAGFEHRLEFEAMLADLSSRFVMVESAEVDHEIEDALRGVCERLGIDYAVLWQWPGAGPRFLTPTHFYPADSDQQPRNPLRQEQFPWVVQQVSAGRTVVIPSLEGLPPEAAADRESAILLGIKSNLTIPLSIGGEPPIGALAFNTLQEERDWPEAMAQRLQLVAQVFTNGLARKRRELSLQESEERLALAANAADAGLWTLDFSTSVFWVTDRGREIFGYSPDEILSMERFEASVHPDDWNAVREAIEQSARTGDPVHVEYRILTGTGTVRWVSSRGRPRFRATGDPESLMGVSIDITERKRGEEALRASEGRLAAGADLAGLAFYEVDFEKGSMYIDDRLRDLCGIPPDGERGLQPLEFWMEHIHPEDRPRMMDLRQQMQDGRIDRLSTEYRYQHPDRGERWIHHLAGVTERDADKRAARTFGVFRDVTDGKRAEERLRDLSRRLIQAQEEERAMLARELHDDLTQRVAVLAIAAGRAEVAAGDEALAASMRYLREGLVRLSEDIHTLAYQLHPSVLEELGLAEALRAECERRSRQGTLGVSLEIGPLPAAVGRDAALCLFRVAQEALSNVARHSGAGTASVSLRPRDGGLLLVVSDHGVGFDSSSSGTARHLGLESMGERVKLANGTLDIRSAPGRGTSVFAWIPVDGGSP